MVDHKKALVDRYAVGVFLVAVYSRARFGDLKRIAKIIVNDVEENNDGSLGFLEMHSESHKMIGLEHTFLSSPRSKVLE